MRNTEATYKLGVEFVNWGRIGDAYMHPFGDFSRSMNGIGFHQYWLKMHQAGQKRDIGEYSFAGFDDTDVARIVWPQLTTIRQPTRQLAAMATDLLLNALSSKPPQPRLLLDYELLARESTGPAPRASGSLQQGDC